MTVETFYADIDGNSHLSCNNAVYSTARTGTGNTLQTTSINVGQGITTLSNFLCMECFFEWDTSGLPDNAVIDSAVISIWVSSNDGRNVDFVLEVRTDDWGASVDTGDFVPGASLSGLTLLASKNQSGWGAGSYADLTSETALISAISKTGWTRAIGSSSKHRAGTSPAEYEYLGLSTTNPPKLTVTYHLPTAHELAGSIQGVGSASGALAQYHSLAGELQGVGVITGELEGTFPLDFTVFDLYLENSTTAQGLILHEDKELKSVNQPIPTQAPKFDVGTNAFEQRPDFGFYFAQGDFSHGAGQMYFHKPSRDELMYFASEGFDISEPGKLTHLHAVLEDEDTAGAGALTQAGGFAYFADGTNVRVGNGAIPGTYSTEDPSAAEAALNVDNCCARGDEVFAAIGAGGLHIRSAAGVWSHWQPDAATDLSIGTATKVAYLKNRIIAVGQAGRDVYEVVASSAPTSMLTLPAGWLFESIFEAGAYIYASAASSNAGLSRIYRFGLNTAGTAMEVKGSDPLPRNELAYAGIGYVGVILIGGGRWNALGGYDPFLYRAIQDDDGSLQLIKIAQASGSGSANLSVCFEPIGEQVLFGWSLGSASPTGVRTGLGSYHIGRGAFSHHLAKAGVSTPARVYSIMYYKGVVLFTILADGLYYEDIAHFVAEATLESSAGDWNNAGLKVWDLIELAHDALPAGAVVTVGYATTLPQGATFVESVVSSTEGSKGTSGKITNISSRVFSVQISSDATPSATSAPDIQSFSVRSNPTRLKPEFELSRFVRIVRAQRKDRGGEMRYEDPLALKSWLEDLMDSWVTVYEPGATWRGFVKAVTPVKPEQPLYKETLGRSQDEVFIIRLDMIATKES